MTAQMFAAGNGLVRAVQLLSVCKVSGCHARAEGEQLVPIDGILRCTEMK
jgi:hypothetical protein